MAMIQLVGPEWPSKGKLLEALSRYEWQNAPTALKVCWGAANVDMALNGGRRLDAVEQMERFREAGLKVPDFTTELPEAEEWVRQGVLVFGRRRLHTRGNDIVGPKHPAWHRREWWVKVVPQVAQEWRVHVFQGKSIARGLKVQIEPPWRKMPVRNRGNGWRMDHKQEPPRGLRTLAKAALAAVGYDFAGVDLLVTEAGDQFILEANRACGLDDYTAAAYAKALREWAMEDGA